MHAPQVIIKKLINQAPKRCDGCLGGAEEINSEQLINHRIYCQVMDGAAGIQSVLEIFQANWTECMD